MNRPQLSLGLFMLAFLCVLCPLVQAQTAPEFPPLETVIKDYTKVVSTADGQRSMYTLYTRSKDGQMLAVLPGGFESKKYFIAMTVASGQDYAGLQAGDMYVYWKRYDKRLALMQPNIEIRSDGDEESKNSVKRLFTDRVILDVPIVAMAGGSPVIDLDALLVGQSGAFFGSEVRVTNSRLIKITKAKAFPQNIEVAFEIPGSGGRLQTMHYSISEIPENTGYTPRKADERVGYFTTSYSDYGRYIDDKIKTRFINRWWLEKADASLQISPPKEPIVFYIEHTTPVRYRRWVRQGILYWNEAFEKVGISNAIEVRYQDKRSSAHMEKDPEDVRYNFVRWLNNNIGTAIGPSRVHPRTGQILDADIILTDGWIRHFWTQYTKIMPEIAMEGFSPEMLAWLAKNPSWDPRVRLAPPSERDHIVHELSVHANEAHGGHPITKASSDLIGDDEYDGLAGRCSQVNGMCSLSQGKAFDVAMFRMQLAMMDDDDQHEDKDKDKEHKADDDKKKEDNKDGDKKEDDSKKDEDKKEEVKKEEKKEEAEKPKAKPEPMIDGMPESFIGPLIAELVCHEVGHTLGLRHNFKGSSVYTLKEINSENLKGKKPYAGSVMDYIGVNMNKEAGDIQGDYTLIGVGPYDLWAIEYGYTQERDLAPILARVAEPELVYATDEDTFGPDPLARRYDFSKDPLDYAENQMRIVKHNRTRLVEKLVKDGESWAEVRKGYETTLSMQLRAVSMMGNWLGGAFVYRDKKGDKNGRLPIEPVPADQQRKALAFVIENTFNDEVFGLSSDLLRRMTVDKWFDDMSSVLDDPRWPVHDRILGIQASALTMIMSPGTMGQIYDNEFLVDADKDAVTLPEVLETVRKAIWTEIDAKPEGQFTSRKPMISSLRRNLQREHIERLIDLSKPYSSGSSASRAIANLSLTQLRDIQLKIQGLDKDKMDAYSRAHLLDAELKIDRALKAQYVYGTL